MNSTLGDFLFIAEVLEGVNPSRSNSLVKPQETDLVAKFLKGKQTEFSKRLVKFKPQ